MAVCELTRPSVGGTGEFGRWLLPIQEGGRRSRAPIPSDKIKPRKDMWWSCCLVRMVKMEPSGAVIASLKSKMCINFMNIEPGN